MLNHSDNLQKALQYTHILIFSKFRKENNFSEFDVYFFVLEKANEEMIYSIFEINNLFFGQHLS